MKKCTQFLLAPIFSSFTIEEGNETLVQKIIFQIETGILGNNEQLQILMNNSYLRVDCTGTQELHRNSVHASSRLGEFTF